MDYVFRTFYVLLDALSTKLTCCVSAESAVDYHRNLADYYYFVFGFVFHDVENIKTFLHISGTYLLVTATGKLGRTYC